MTEEQCFVNRHDNIAYFLSYCERQNFYVTFVFLSKILKNVSTGNSITDEGGAD